MRLPVRLLLMALIALLLLPPAALGAEAMPEPALPDLNGLRVGIMTGAVGETWVLQEYPDADIKRFDDTMDGIAALKAGAVDYFVTSKTTAYNVAGKNADLTVLPNALTKETTNIAVSKDSPELLQKVNELLNQMKADGSLDNLIDRWIKIDGSPYEEIEIELPTDGPVLRVAVAANREPMCYLDDRGEVRGLDAELARRIAAYLGMQVEFRDMKFSTLIMEIQAGKSDLAISNITYTEERAQMIDFSVAYFSNPQVLLTRAPKAAAVEKGFFESIADSFTNNVIKEQRYLLLLSGLKTTLMIAALSAVLGTLLGMLTCAMRISRHGVLRALAGGYINLFRGVPVLVVLMFTYYVAFAKTDVSASLVSVVALGMNFAAYAAEVFRAGLLAVDPGQREAALASGFSGWYAFLYIVLPQATRHVWPVYQGELISLLKTTSIVGYIAVQDLTKAGDIIRSRTFDAFFPLAIVAVLYFLLSWLLIMALRALSGRKEVQL